MGAASLFKPINKLQIKQKNKSLKPMKTFFLFMSIFLFISCSNDEEVNEPEIQDNYVKMSIDGMAETEYPYVTLDTSIVAHFVYATRDDAAFELVTFTIAHPITIGQPSQVDPSTMASIFWRENSQMPDIFSTIEENGTGSITVTEMNSTFIEGTFEFTGANGNGATMEFTDGKFKAYYE